jgi:hypothetical protein
MQVQAIKRHLGVGCRLQDLMSGSPFERTVSAMKWITVEFADLSRFAGDDVHGLVCGELGELSKNGVGKATKDPESY